VTSTRLLLPTLALAALGLMACDADEPSGAPGGHTLAAQPDNAVAPPVTEARSERRALQGAVAAPAASAQSDHHRLVTTGLSPKIRR
jgi:hypothetical protein